jgi:nonsense-mediated mRNA decay protein 3
LISHDIHTNTYNYKISFSCEIVPICKDNIVCLGSKLAQSLGNLGQLCVVLRVTHTVHLIDPNTCQSRSQIAFCHIAEWFLSVAEVTGERFWRSPFSSVCEPKQLVEFTVMDVEIIMDKDRKHVAGGGALSNKVSVGADVYPILR